jgi:DegV family protein with EDD domain
VKILVDPDRQESPMVKIVADSTCNLPPEVLRQYDIRVAPIAIQFGERTFEEEVTIDRDHFYTWIEETGTIPKTSQPSPMWFERFYGELTSVGHSVLAITVTAHHSGTYQAAILAKSMVPGADVEVFDSRSISLGTGWMVLEAARAAEAGSERASIISQLEQIRSSSRLFLTPLTLKYLQMSGRVGKLQGALASLLSVKPIIALRDGVLEAIENVRTRSRALDRILQLLVADLRMKGPVNAAVIHARAPEEARALGERLRSSLECREVIEGDLVASLAVHGGPGVIGLFAYPA